MSRSASTTAHEALPGASRFSWFKYASPQTFYPLQYDNLNVVETYGRNSRIAFPYRAIERLRGSDRLDASPTVPRPSRGSTSPC